MCFVKEIKELIKIRAIKRIYYLIFLLILIQLNQCSRQVIVNTKSFLIQKTQEDIPVINLQKLHSSFPPINLLLDTGSSELTIFDDQCYSCSYKLSVCPHIKQKSNQTLINYVSSKFLGDFSYLTLGEDLRVRFFCVLQIQGNNTHVQSNGIIGIKAKNKQNLQSKIKQSTGLQIWKKIIKKVYQIQSFSQNLQNNLIIKTLSPLKFAILYDVYQTKIILGNISQIFTQTLVTQFSLQSPIYLQKLNFFDQLPIFNNQIHHQTVNQRKQGQKTVQNQKINQVHFDTGSSVIVLPQQYFKKILNQLKQIVSKDCRQSSNGMIQCPKHSIKKLIQSSFLFSLTINQEDQVLKKSSVNLQIELEYLIQKRRFKSEEQYFQIKIISHKSSNESISNSIILGVPVFKKYLIQYQIDEQILKSSEMNLTKNVQNKINMKIFDFRGKNNNQSISYEHLIKKYDKNIKMITILYILVVFIVSIFLIRTYWWIQNYIKRKRYAFA